MNSYFVYYTEASVVCTLFFLIILLHDILNVDRQEKQIRYDHALVAFMHYFICDAFWAAVIAGILPRNHFTVLTANFGNYILMAAITYTWLRYVMAVEQIPGRDDRLTILSILFPFIIATIALIATYIFAPHVLLDDALELQPGYSAFQITVPCIYIAAILIYTLKRAKNEENPIEKKRHLFVGLFPLFVVMGGLVQILLLPETPVFCFCCALLMLVFYINTMQMQISTDPLTALNNRGQLLHYISQASNRHIEGKQTYVVMFDINDFKLINDTHGHAEGDKALIIVADSLRYAARTCGMPMFLARYGGDEFIVIAYAAGGDVIESMIGKIRGQIEERCRTEGKPYVISIGAGYDELSGDGDTFQKCIQRADDRLYMDKADQKLAVLHHQ